MKKTMTFLGTVLLLCGFSLGDERPNILLMMVDDLGFSDFGCYGGEIKTPNIDALAKKGVSFTQFYNTAKCHSSRVSLLTGLYCNQAGNSSLSRATTLAEVSAKVGYTTSMTGKWHLKKHPMDFGFDRYWGHLSGATDFFQGDKTFYQNREKWSDFAEGFYMTDANVSFSLKMLQESIDSKKPFFHYIAFNAPHYPLQAKKEDVEKYLGRYDVGWDVIRKRRFQKQQQLGFFGKEDILPPRPRHIPAWDGLSAEAKEFESFRMAVYAAMVDSVDQNIGRLLDFLKDKGMYENTLIMLLSDNGACPFERSKRMEHPPWEGGTHLCYDGSWAMVGNTPFKHYKQTQHEGGISTPFIAHWPKGIVNPGRKVVKASHLVDVMATVLDVAEGTYPKSDKIQPLQGKSLLPFFKGEHREEHKELYFEFGKCRALRQGDWKLVSFYNHRWELYNMSSDRFEQKDLAAEHPEIVAKMAERWIHLAKHKDFRQPKPIGGKSSPEKLSSWHNSEVISNWVKPEGLKKE